MANRLLERLADGPPLVADGGMGVLVSSAAPRVRIPEEANLRAPGSCRIPTSPPWVGIEAPPATRFRV